MSPTDAPEPNEEGGASFEDAAWQTSLRARTDWEDPSSNLPSSHKTHFRDLRPASLSQSSLNPPYRVIGRT